MSTALGQVTRDLWLLAHPSTTVHCLSIRGPLPSREAQLCLSQAISGNPGQSAWGLTVSPTLSCPAVGYTAALVHFSAAPPRATPL